MVTFSGNVTFANVKRVTRILGLIAPNLPTELVEVRFDSSMLVAPGLQGRFIPPGLIILENKLTHWEPYITAHELGHELDHATTTKFSRIRTLIGLPERDLNMLVRWYYGSAMQRRGMSDELKLIEGTAVALGCFYGGRPWALQKVAPHTMAMLRELHLGSGGKPFWLDDPEHANQRRAYTWQPGVDNYAGPIYIRALWRQMGWDKVLVWRRTWRLMPRSLRRLGGWKVYTWNKDVELDRVTTPSDPRWNQDNTRLKDGDFIIREVPK